MIYFAFVYSRLCYGSEIYGNTYQTHLSKLHILNNKILRILQNKPRHTHVIEVYKTYNINTIYDIHKLQILILVHTFFHHHERVTSGISWRCLIRIKQEWLGYRVVKKTDNIRFHRIPERDGRTDRWTDRQNCYINIARQHTDAQ